MLVRDLSSALPPPAVPTPIIRSLMEGVGDSAFSDHVLQALNYVVEFDHCTLYEFCGDDAPILLGMSSWNSPKRVARSTRAYLEQFHHLDPARAMMREKGERLFLRYHNGYEIKNSEFRKSCYDGVAILDRLSVVASVNSGSWFVANFFRDAAREPLQTERVDRISEHAFLIGLAGKQDIFLRRGRAQQSQAGLGCPLQPAGASMQSATPLSPRERQVCDLILSGHPQSDIARRLGVFESSVITYRRRAYQKLGVSSARALRQLGHLEPVVV